MSLCSLAEMGERNKALVREQGGIGDVIEAMRMYREHTGLQKEACSALASLARYVAQRWVLVHVRL